MKPHKFIHAGEGYEACIFCEYCGLVVWCSNDSNVKIREREEERLKQMSCPTNPKQETSK